MPHKDNLNGKAKGFNPTRIIHRENGKCNSFTWGVKTTTLKQANKRITRHR